MTQNPFKLIYHVLKYAIKNKLLRCESAFTYCEDGLPSHIGEQVEDVKMFFKLLGAILLDCILPSVVFMINHLSIQIYKFINPHVLLANTTRYCSKILYAFATTYTAGVVILLYEFVVHPCSTKTFCLGKKL